MWHKVKKLDTKTIKSIHYGEWAQLKVEMEAARRGYGISVPTIPLKYDLIIDDNKKLYKCQIKYLNRKSHGKDCLELQLKNKSQKKYGYTNKDIDVLLIYVAKLDVILCVGPKLFHNKKTLSFNLDNPKSKVYYKKYLW